MKKYLFGMLLLSVAGLATTAFVSCEEKSEDVVEQKVEQPKEDYLGFKYWTTNDVLEVADVVTTGIGSLKFNTDATIDGAPGKVSDVVELTGQQAKDASFSVKFKMKSNWKELLGKKDVFKYGEGEGVTTTKIVGSAGFDINANTGTFMREDLGDKFEEKIESHILNNMGFDYK